MRAPSKARALIAGTLALGAGTVVSALFLRADARWTTLALLGAAAILTETIQVPSDESSPDPGDAHSFSLSSGVHYAAVIMIGPWTGALIAVFGVVVADRLRGVGWRFVAFNASVFAGAVAGGGLVYWLPGATARGHARRCTRLVPLSPLCTRRRVRPGPRARARAHVRAGGPAALGGPSP